MANDSLAPGVRLKIFAAVAVIATAGAATFYWAGSTLDGVAPALWAPAAFLVFLLVVAALSEAIGRLMLHDAVREAADRTPGRNAAADPGPSASRRRGVTGAAGDIVRASRERLDAIRRIGISVNSTMNLEEVLHDILQATLDAVGATVGMVFLRDPDTGCLRMGASAGLSQAFVTEYRYLLIAPGEGLTGRVAETRAPIIVERNVSDDPRVKVAAAVAEDLNSYVGVPIVVKGECVAVMNILTRPPDRLTEKDVVLALAVGEYLGTAIRNTRVVDELTRATDEARRSWHYLRSITDSIEDGIVVIEPDRTISYANSAYARQAGLQAEDVIGRPCFTISHGRAGPCRPPAHECPLETVFKEGRPHIAIHRHVDREGNPSWVEVVCSPMLGLDGAVARGVEVTRDITERRRMEEALMRSEKLAALGKMAATIAHEVRNPLASMRGALSVLRSSSDSSTDVEVVLDEIIGQVDRLSETTRVLLSFALPALPGRVECDLNRVIEQARKNVERQASGQGIDVVLDLERTSCVVSLDPQLTAQALSNIAMNAIEAVERGGVVTMTSAFKEDAAVVTVTDNGPGIEPGNLEQVFHPFFTTKARGIGLGLFTARHIIEQQGGTVAVESTPGEGARFVITLPLGPAAVS